jgi:hypothetical protein
MDGFELLSIPFPGVTPDWYDPEAVSKVLFPIAEKAVLAACPGATKVIVFDHIARNDQRMMQQTDGTEKTNLGLREGLASSLLAGPAHGVHGDYTARSGFTRIRELLSPHESSARIDTAMEGRLAIVNLWVPLREVERDPLGLVEWGSMNPEDVITVRRIHPHRSGEIYHGVPSQKHRWIYFPRMRPGEAIAIKTFDSSANGASRFNLHSAFTDSSSPASAPPRESIEVRTIVFFGDLPRDFAKDFIAPHLDPASPDHNLSPPKIEKLPPSCEW